MKQSLLPLFLLFSIVLNAQTDYPDCQGAFLACNKQTIVVHNMGGMGENPHEVGLTSCYDQPFPESHSAWLKWQIDKGGSLGFTILPLNAKDDLDFVLFRMNGKLACDEKTEIRCMASGENRGEADAASSTPCTGATGLTSGADDLSETPGCQGSDDNFLANAETQSGEWYLLFVNNFHSGSGFMLEFSGNATFAAVPGDCVIAAPPNTLEDLKLPGLTFGLAYPNPAASELVVPVESPQAMDGSMQVIDLQGNVRFTKAVSLSMGRQILSVPTQELPTGVYFLKINFGDSVHLVRFSKF